MHSNPIRTPFLATVAALGALALPSSAQATFVGLGTSVTNITVNDVSADGTAIVGRGGSPSSAYLWTTANPTWTLVPGSAGSSKYSVSNGGAYLAATLPDPSNANLQTAARWNASTGQWTFLPGLGATSGTSLSSSYDISADGSVVVGLGWISANKAHAFRWDAATGVTTDLGSTGGAASSSRPNGVSPDGGTAVGWDADPITGVWRAARWVGTNESLLGCLDPADPINGPSEAYVVSSNGQFIAGESSTGLSTPSGWGEQHSFRWDAVNGLMDIGTPPVDPFGWGTHKSTPTGISDDGRTVVGWGGVVAFGPGVTQPQFIWREGSGMALIGSFLTALGVPQGSTWVFQSIAGVSADGRVIAGHGLNPLNQREGFMVVLPPIAESYCTAKINSQGCTPAILSNGIASQSSFLPFDVGAANVLNNKSGLLFFGLAPFNAPFQGGTMCVASPTARTPIQDSHGSPIGVDDCSGSYSFDFNALIQSGVNPFLTVGTKVYAQYWSRDPAMPSTTGLTNALSFTIFP